MEGIVQFATLAPDVETAQIAEQLAHFRTHRQDFEWKVHAIDRPSDLRERLTALGFEAGDEETLKAFRCRALDAPVASPSCEVRRVVDAAGIDALMALQRQVWNEDFDWLRTLLVDRLRDEPDTLSIYSAYVDGELVGGGWTDFPAGSRFPELHGGAVLPKARGRGVYRALFEVRIAEATRRGYDTLCVDASAMSRPILERIGFAPICHTVPMRMTFAR
jgi:GNAT superfamily N-acetyltransferase